MTSSEFVIRPATQEDLTQWYGSLPAYTTRALVGVLNGEVIALGGVYRDNNAVVGIAGLKPPMRGRRKDIVRMIRATKELLQNYPVVLAFADRNEPTADGFIRHLGFDYVRPTPIGDLYACHRE